MILKLDPRFPLVWRDPFSLQIGIDPALARLDNVTETQERMLAALTVGVGHPGLTMIAQGRAAERDELLKTLAPVLAASAGPAPATVAISGHESLVEAISAALGGSGVHVLVAKEAADLAELGPDLAIIAGEFVLAPELHALWLRRDVPHLPVVLSDGAVTVGPFVDPGTGPCLLCVELHRRDSDAAWPAIATQLLGRRSRAETPVLVAEAAATASRLVLGRLRAGPASCAVSVRIDGATGGRREQEWVAHAECGCRGIPPLLQRAPATAARRETGWAAAALRAPAAG